jgi:resolvase-like protein
VALRLNGYVRVSRVGGRQGEGYISPAVQREAIEPYAQELGGQIVAWHQDEDYSGGNVERLDFQPWPANGFSEGVSLDGGTATGPVV